MEVSRYEELNGGWPEGVYPTLDDYSRALGELQARESEQRELVQLEQQYPARRHAGANVVIEQTGHKYWSDGARWRRVIF